MVVQEASDVRKVENALKPSGGTPPAHDVAFLMDVLQAGDASCGLEVWRYLYRNIVEFCRGYTKPRALSEGSGVKRSSEPRALVQRCALCPRYAHEQE